MKFPFALLALAICQLYSVAAENLTPYGNFEAPASELKPFVTSTFAKMSFVQEHPGDNHCVKVEITKISQNKDGTQGVHANVICKFSLEPDTSYHFSFDLKGSAPRFLIDLKEEDGRKLVLKFIPEPPVKTAYHEIIGDWKEYKGTFRTQKGGQSQLFVTLWHNTYYGKMFYSVGDYFLLDNLKIWK